MSTKENKELTQEYGKELSEVTGDLTRTRARADKYLGDDYVYHTPSGDWSRERTIQILGAEPAFPDVKYTRVDAVAEGDKVAMRYTMEGTHKGPLMGILPTGKHFAISGVTMTRIKAGKVAEEWDFPDLLGLMTQLGLIPAPKK